MWTKPSLRDTKSERHGAKIGQRKGIDKMTFDDIVHNKEILEYYKWGSVILGAQFSLQVSGQRVL
jgi:hypothetical protein